VTFDRVVVPETSVDRMAYIAAVHPKEPDRVFVRVDDTQGTAVFSSDDGGRTLRKVFTGSGRLLGFALAPDGTQIAVGGAGDGIWIAAADSLAFERKSSVEPSCLAWNQDGLYACADASLAGFSFGRSQDSAATFERLLNFDSLCGTSACGGDTPVGKLCPLEWAMVAPSLAASCPVSSDAGADQGDRGGDAPGPRVGPDAANGGAQPRSMEGNVDASGGCAVARRGARGCSGALFFGAALFLLVRRHGRRLDVIAWST
jgi:hypothetical protein